MKTLISVLIAVLLLSTAAVVTAHTEDAPLVTPLLAGQTEPVGNVLVWNDADYLYVKFVTVAPWYMMETHVAVGDSLDDIPTTKKGNPIPGQFEYGSTHGPVLVREYEIPLAGLGGPLFIAAHAATNLQSAMWVCSDGTETYTAMSGPGTTSNPNTEYADPLNPPDARLGTSVLTWNHPSWISNVNLQFTCGQWVWESYRCVNPIYGDVVDFYKSFTVPGLPNGGTLWITADNGYKASLNGTPLVGDGLSEDWRNSDLTEGFVTTAMAAWSSVEVAAFLTNGENTFHFETANEYMNPDDINPTNPVGTIDNNPGGLIYEAYITYYEDGETAWGDGTEFVDDRGWATYIEYEVTPAPCAEPSGSLTITGTGWNSVSAWCPCNYTYDLTETGEPIALQGFVDVSEAAVANTGGWSKYYAKFSIIDSSGNTVEVVFGNDWLGDWWTMPSQPWDRIRMENNMGLAQPFQYYATVGGVVDRELDGTWVGTGNGVDIYPSDGNYLIQLIADPAAHTFTLQVYGKGSGVPENPPAAWPKQNMFDEAKWLDFGTINVGETFDFEQVNLCAILWASPLAGEEETTTINWDGMVFDTPL